MSTGAEDFVFPGTLPVDPYLDVVARYTIAPYDVDVVLGGTARTPTLECAAIRVGRGGILSCADLW